MSWQSSSNSAGKVVRLAISMLACAMFCPAAARADEPCNPIVDGTYCATQMPKSRGYVGSSSGLKPLDDYSRLVPSASGPPGTLMGFSVQSNQTCFGLLRRSTCK
jgi:hypothetical protein